MQPQLVGTFRNPGGVPASQLSAGYGSAARCFNCKPASSGVGLIRETDLVVIESRGVCSAANERYTAPHRATQAPAADRQFPQRPALQAGRSIKLRNTAKIEPAPVRQTLEHVNERTTAPAIAPERSPPLAMNGQQLTAPEWVFEAIPELEFDQTLNLVAEAGRDQWTHPAGTDTESVPELEFDQTLGL